MEREREKERVRAGKELLAGWVVSCWAFRAFLSFAQFWYRVPLLIAIPFLCS